MKRQIGIWVDALVWQGCGDLRGRERLRPAEPIEELLEFVLRNGSAVAVLDMLRGMGKADSFEAFARVLLGWHLAGKVSGDVTDEEQAPVEYMLLQALKNVTNPQLRKEIEQSLKNTRKRR